MKIKNKVILADLSLLLVAIIWGSGFIFMKNALDYIDPINILALRFSISAIIMSIIFYKRFENINKRLIIDGSLIGFFLFLAFLTQTIGLQYTTVSKQAFITSGNVVLVPILYWVISRQAPDKFEFISVFLCFLGIGILSLDSSFTIGLGDGLTMVCAFFFACHIVSVGFFAKKHDVILLTIIQFASAALFSILLSLIIGTPLNSLNNNMVFAILYMSIISTLLAFGIQNVAQKYTSSTHAALILSLESVFGSFFSILFLNESITSNLLIGSIIVLISIITAETKWEFLSRMPIINQCDCQ